MKSLFRQIWKPLLLLIPLLIGLVGFLQEGEGFLQALFNCVCMYVLNYQDAPANLLIETSRWLAPLATASGLVIFLAALRQSLHQLLARCTGNSVAVYGPEAEKNALLKELGIRGISMEKDMVKARHYILMGTEEENLAFYQENRERLSGREVYLKCQSLPAQASAHANLHLFCPEETAARFFWKTYCPDQLSTQCGHQMKIVIIGFQKLGRELLVQALQNNIFHADQRIEYHIFGSSEGFTSVYRQLSQIADPVILHKEPWYDSMALLEQADMRIVAQQEDQIALLRDLNLALPGKSIYTLTENPAGTAMLPDIISFDWKTVTHHPDHILGSRLHEYAKKINLRYAHLYSGVEETEQNREAQWNLLDAFTRYSNISAADYHEVQQKMLAHAGQPDPLAPEWLERLSELEHIRWCRYHYLNNWQYGVPENGKNKDPQRRIHAMLIPYAQLQESEKEKDRENIRILFDLDTEN